MTRAKWFVRTGVLILMLGFFMPTMLVSCSGMTGFEQSFSLADMASQFSQPILYLFLLGALAAGIFSFLPPRSSADAKNFLLGQVIAVGVALLSMIIAVLSLTSQIKQGTYGMFNMRPDYGVFALAGGLLLFAVGWFEQWAALGAPIFRSPLARPVEPYVPTQNMQPPPPNDWQQRGPVAQVDLEEEDDWTPSPGPAAETVKIGKVELQARLEPVKGSLPRKMIPVDYDNFTIGRSSDNSLVIHDTAVSRHHARLRYAAGAWFIQDTESAAGVIVNGETVPAMRLEPGDEIEIAGNVFIFRC